MNVLLTCAGRRNYLVEYFRSALPEKGEVYAADVSADAPALQVADRAFIVPAIGDTSYIDRLIAICQEHQVRLLIPLNDLELLPLARERDRFLEIGTIPVVSSPDVVMASFDKLATVEFLKELRLPFPKTYLSVVEARRALSQGEVAFPLVVKPRWGTASIGIEFPQDCEELELAYRLLRKKLKRTILSEVSATDHQRSVLIQEKLPGQEYGLDIINDLNGRYVSTFAKRKIGMRSGETSQAMTVEDDRLQRLGETIGRKLAHVGNLDCDVFVTHESVYVLEMNPRFGGGYPFTHVAGANVPAMLLAWSDGKSPSESWREIESNVKAAKYDQLLVCRDF